MYRGMFETQKSGNKTSLGEIGITQQKCITRQNILQHVLSSTGNF